MFNNFLRAWDSLLGRNDFEIPWGDDGTFVRLVRGPSAGAVGFPIPLGKVRVTPAARRALRAAGVSEKQILLWHASGYSGAVTGQEQQQNEENARNRNGGLIASMYILPGSGFEILVSSSGSYTGRRTTFVFVPGD